jgi:hypothetical protein
MTWRGGAVDRTVRLVRHVAHEVCDVECVARDVFVSLTLERLGLGLPGSMYCENRKTGRTHAVALVVIGTL